MSNRSRTLSSMRLLAPAPASSPSPSSSSFPVLEPRLSSTRKTIPISIASKPVLTSSYSNSDSQASGSGSGSASSPSTSPPDSNHQKAANLVVNRGLRPNSSSNISNESSAQIKLTSSGKRKDSEGDSLAKPSKEWEIPKRSKPGRKASTVEPPTVSNVIQSINQNS